MALFWRIWAAVTIVTFTVLVIFMGLATLQFGQVNAELVAERLVVLAHRTAAPFEAAARIGLPLSTVRNAAALLERARQTDEAITAIHVFDRAGGIVHSTEKSPPETIPFAEIALGGDAGSKPRYFETDDEFHATFDIAGPGGVAAGGIVVAYAGRESVTRVRAMAAELALMAITILLVSAALGGLLLRLGLAPQIGAFEAIDQAVAEFERDSWRSAAGQPTKIGKAPDELRSLLDAADMSYRAAGRAIAAAQEADRR